MYCKKCGQEIDEKGKFCPHCGVPVECGESPSKKNAKKPIYKRWWIWAIAILLLLGSCGIGSDAPEGHTPTTATAATEGTVATAATITAETSPVVESIPSIGLDAAVSLIDSVIKGNYKNYEIYHEDGLIVLNLWDSGIAAGAALAAGGSAKHLASWNKLVETQKNFSLKLDEFLESIGLDGTTVMVNVLNDANTENVLLSVAHGIVISNCVE